MYKTRFFFTIKLKQKSEFEIFNFSREITDIKTIFVVDQSVLTRKYLLYSSLLPFSIQVISGYFIIFFIIREVVFG